MMKKKAMEVKTAFLGIALLMFMLAIYFLYVTGAGRDLFTRIGIIVPDLNASSGNISEIEIVRYDVPNDKVQWYDGVNWWDFESDRVFLGNKEIDRNKLRYEFKDYFYSFDLRKNNSIVELDPRIIEKLYSPCSESEICTGIPFVKGCIFFQYMNIQSTRDSHDIIINLINEDSMECPPGIPVGGIISLRSDNRVELLKVSEIKEVNGEKRYIMGGNFEIIRDTNLADDLRNKIDLWKFEELSKPIGISYYEEKDLKSGDYCVEEFDNRFLVVNLAEPRAQC